MNKEGAGMLKKESQTEEALAGLERAVSALEGRLGVLDNKLSPVLRDEMPENTKVDAIRAEQTYVPLADSIRSQRYRIEALLRLTDSLIDRAEV